MEKVRENISKRNEIRQKGMKQSAKQGTSIPSLVTAVQMIRLTELSVRSMNEMGSFTDDDAAKVAVGEATVVSLKQQATKELNDYYAVSCKLYEPPTAEDVEELENFFEALVTQTDINPVNLPLAHAFLKVVRLDYVTLCDERGLLSIAACDSSLGYLEALLQVPNIRCDLVEVASSCLFNQQARIPAAALLLKYDAVLNLGAVADDLRDAWLEFFADISSNKRAIAREDRKGRLQLIEALCKFCGIPIVYELEGPDSQTVFSRAAYEGDAELLQLFVKLGAHPPVNRLQSDGTTALMQAVVSNDPQCVKVLLGLSDIDVSIKGENGTALELAVVLKRNPAIIAMLKVAPRAKSGRGDGMVLPALKGVVVPKQGTKSAPATKVAWDVAKRQEELKKSLNQIEQSKLKQLVVDKKREQRISDLATGKRKPVVL